MKKTIKFIGIVAVAAATVLLASCNKETAKSYELKVNVTLPDGVGQADINDIAAVAVKGSKTVDLTVEKIEVKGEDVPVAYVAAGTLTQGDYKVTVTGKITETNSVIGTADVSLYEDVETTLALSVVSKSPLLIKAFQYTPGKQYYIQPLSDTWIEIVNNSDEVQYLDQIILVGGMGGQKQANAWQANGFAHLYGGVTQSPVFAFPGNGTDYPLQPGKSVVIANAPINHQAQGAGFENCTDLSHADWEFYCSYNAKDTDYEGIPNLSFIFTSFNSQANWGQGFFYNGAMLVKLPAGITPAQYAANEENLMTTPGTTSKSQYLIFPNNYVLDAVDIWDGTEEEHYPVFLAVDDAKGIIGAEAWSGQAVRRKVTKIENGRAYYKDTNNSSNDFVVAKVIPGAEPTEVDAD
jgi:hypothetical protein